VPAPGVGALVTTAPLAVTIKEGERTRINATAFDAAGRALSGVKCSWTINSADHATVASVDDDTGEVTARRATRKGPAIAGGTLRVTATCGGKAGSSAVVVN
jgi:hypothetical protein